MTQAYLYCTNKEIITLLTKNLQEYELEHIDNASELFEKDFDNKILLVHAESDENIEELLSYLIKDYPSIKVLLLSNIPNLLDGSKYVKMGVKGYGNTYMQPIHLMQAVEVILSDNIWLYPELTLHLIQNFQAPATTKDETLMDTLTEHERECAMLTAEGNSNKQTAKLMNIQEVTVKKYLSSIYKKLSVKNRVELTLLLK